LSPRDLWRRVERQSERARAAGALQRIETEARFVEEGGVEFVVRKATSRREAAGRREADPFSDPEPDLFVADLSATHYALLNKYNVLDHALLVVTREDIDQDVPLDPADFGALATCMGDVPALGFYNGGAAGGASQRHKHLQVVPLPLSPRCGIPIESLLRQGAPQLPLRCASAKTDLDAGRLHGRYTALRHALGLSTQPYNLLVTRDWMLLVARSRPAWEGIPVNSLGFAGALFVRSDEELALVERIGPMALLQGVSIPKDLP
jgi:ATP adenylyltransferase